MKKVKQINGYTIYEATTQRDVDNYGCNIGSYNIYLSADIRDYGLSYSDPEWDDVDSLATAIAMCNGSQWATACALAEEISGSTAQDMDLCLEIERRLDAGEALSDVRAALRKVYLDEDDDDELDGDLGDDDDDELDDEAALRDWELSAVEVGDYMLDGYRAWKVTGKDHSTGEWRLTVESPIGESYCIDAESAGRARFIGAGADWADKRHVAELWSGHEIASHATYYVVESEGDYYTKTVNISINWYESSEARLNRHRYAFLRAVAERYAFNDCCDDRILEIVFDGCRIEYAGWQRGMRIVFREAGTGLVVFDESFPEWDH